MPSSLFFHPKNLHLAPKMPHFNGYLALFGHVLNGSNRYVYTNCGELLCFSPCISQHFALHLAPFYLAFSTKTHCILHQNALRLAANCTAFSTKTHFILLNMAQKWVLVAVGLNKNSFCLHVQLSPCCTQANLRENRFFAARLAIG